MSSTRACAASRLSPAARLAPASSSAAPCDPRSRLKKRLNVFGSHLDASASSIHAVTSSISLSSPGLASAPLRAPATAAASRPAAPSLTCARVSHIASRRRAPLKITS